MSFPIDQFTSLPPAASTSSRPQVDEVRRTEGSARRDYDAGRSIERGHEDDSRASARAENDRSDFQQHLDDEADMSAQSQKEPQAMASARPSQPEDRGEHSKETHGFKVSETAKASELPDKAAPSDETTTPRISTGNIIKAVASDKTGPVIETADDIDTGTEEPTSLQTSSLEGTAGTIPTPGQQEASASDPTSADTTEVKPEGAAQVAVIEDGPFEDGSDAAPEVTVLPVQGSGPLFPSQTAPDDLAETGVVPSAPQHNSNAQKVEGSERPGWGANHAPRSDRGSQARDLKAQNSGAAVKTSAGTTSQTEEAGKTKASEAPTPTTTAVDETTIIETVAPDHMVGRSETIPTTAEPSLVAAVGGETVPVMDTTGNNGEKPEGLSAVSGASATTPGQSGSADGPVAPRSEKARSAKRATPASPQANSQASSQAATTAKAAAEANANAAASASPTGVAQALASGQGKMPMTGMPAAEQIGQTLTGIDKRGTRTGAKASETPGDTTGAVKVGKAKAEGSTQSTFDPTQHKSPAIAKSHAAQSQPSAAAATAQSGTGSAQGTTSPAPAAPAMPDPAVLANNADMNLPRGTATIEIDPTTGALHLSGTGSAKMSSPNLSEVTLRFSRARMVQTPAKDIAVQIARHLSNGVNRFDIRITPPELGRIEVKLEIAESGKIAAHLVADKPETLDLLQKDRATLERALAEAGLNADEGSLEFSMREGKGESDPDFKALALGINSDGTNATGPVHIENLAELEVSTYGFDIVRMKRLDISI